MALAFFSGVSQITLSTPGVFLPWFSVTRRTASALPLNEWVSRCCKARALFHRPAFVAFTMRAWSRRTFLWTACQSMACQPACSWETAPTGSGGAVVICFVSFVGSPNSLVMPDPSEVSALSRRGCRTPYPPDYRAAFAFSDLPHPHRPGSALRPSSPRTRERYGLLMFHWNDHGWVRFSLFAGSGRGP